MIKRKNGFTLAEVLITLAIIGIVAVLTISGLVSKYEDKQIVTAVKKNFTVLNNALTMAIIENGPVSGWPLDTWSYNAAGRVEDSLEEEIITDEFTNLDNMVKYLNVIRDCGHEANGCFSHRYTNLNGTAVRDFENLPYYRKLVLNDGTLVAMQGYEGGSGEIWIDVNGQKAPNTVGKDMFLFQISRTKQRVMPWSSDKPGCSTKWSGYACSLWVVEFSNRDYLKCQWTTWGKCEG